MNPTAALAPTNHPNFPPFEIPLIASHPPLGIPVDYNADLPHAPSTDRNAGPNRDENPAMNAVAGPQNFSPSPDHPWRGNILIVDDTLDNIRLLSSLLADYGYRVRKAINSDMAMLAVERERPDLILLDINMPGRNGYDTCQLLKQNGETQSIPVIFLSALDDALDKVRAFQVGGADYITKPFHLEEVLARIENQLELQRSRRVIEQQNRRLQDALGALQRSQLEQVRRAQLVGMGQLAAGVAQEMNNPMSFIRCNVGPATQYVEQLLALVEAYGRALPDPPLAVVDCLDAMDLGFVREDFPRLLRAMQHGADRIQGITAALGVFSQLDESERRLWDLHGAVDSAVLLLAQKLRGDGRRPAIAVEIGGENLPKISCYGGQLTWVLIDWLGRAIAAIDRAYGEKRLVGPPVIAITTALERDDQGQSWMRLTIRDNGCGLESCDQPYCYDSRHPEMTDDPTLNFHLAASHQVVVGNHGGALRLEFAPTVGSVFEMTVSAQLDWAGGQQS
jgi:CheY-like chemotaxis protein